MLYGTPQNYAAGALTRVYIPISSVHTNRMIDGILAQHNEDGSHNNITANSVTTTAGIIIGGALAANGTISGITPAKFQNPYKFSAYRSTSFTGASGNNNMIFDTVEYDTGSNYSNTTGKFTAPIAGFYTFSSTINAAVNNGGWSSIALAKNGTNIRLGSGFVGYVPGGAQTMAVTVSADVQLAANDYVQVIWVTNGVPVYQGQSGVFFQGHLISQT